MTDTAYEADGVRLSVTVTGGTAEDPAPEVLGFVSAFANRRGYPEEIQGAAVATGNVIAVSYAPGALVPGRWSIQVRAGTDQATARTVREIGVTVLDSFGPNA